MRDFLIAILHEQSISIHEIKSIVGDGASICFLQVAAELVEIGEYTAHILRKLIEVLIFQHIYHQSIVIAPQCNTCSQIFVCIGKHITNDGLPHITTESIMILVEIWLVTFYNPDIIQIYYKS